MTEKELKKLNRKQLLELLLIQTNRADELEKRLSEMQKALNDREITLSEAGSIAEAALKLNGIFEAADAAAKQYLDNIKRLESALSARSNVTGVSSVSSVDEPEQNENSVQTESMCEELPEEKSPENQTLFGENQCRTKKIILSEKKNR